MSDDTLKKIQDGIDSLMSFAPPPPTQTRDKGPPGETFLQKLSRKCTAEPLVPLGAAITVGCLTTGLRAFHKGNAIDAQKLMRGRVLAQGFTVCMMIMGAYAGFKPGGDKPKDYETKLGKIHINDNANQNQNN